MLQFLYYSTLFFSLSTCFKSEETKQTVTVQTIKVSNHITELSFDKIETQYINKSISGVTKDEIKKQLLIATKKDKNNPLTEFYKSESLVIKEYLCPLPLGLKSSKVYYISNTIDEKVEALLLLLQSESRKVVDQYLLFEKYDWEAEILKKSKIEDNIIYTHFIEIQKIDENENLVLDTIKNYTELFAINGNLTLSKMKDSIFRKETYKILEQYNYDFNFDDQTDKAQLIQTKENKTILTFFQNSNGVYNLLFETEVPHKNVYFEKEKITKGRLAISLVEKQQLITEYIEYDSIHEAFRIREICRSINEITPVGYKQREKCKTLNFKISNVTFIKAIDLID